MDPSLFSIESEVTATAPPETAALLNGRANNNEHIKLTQTAANGFSTKTLPVPPATAGLGESC